MDPKTASNTTPETKIKVEPKVEPQASAGPSTSTGTIPKMMDFKGKKIPVRCEMCDVDVPDMKSRTAHMKETKHCYCPDCKEYMPPGGIYSHYCDKHPELIWNDHAFAFSDMKDMENVMPWVKEIRAKEAEK